MNVPPIEISPEMVAYVSLAVQTLKRFIPPSMVEIVAPFFALVFGAALGYTNGGVNGIPAGIMAGLAAISAYEGAKMTGRKMLKKG